MPVISWRRAANRDVSSNDPHPALADRIILEWPSDRPFRIAEVLRQHPQLADSSRAMIELAIEEYNDRCESGETLTASQFAQQFPRIRSALLDSLAVDRAVAELTGIFLSRLSASKDQIAWPEIGETIADFHLLELLGQGSFSRVFLAEDLQLEPRRKVAVKICSSDTHEVDVLADLQHSAICPVYYVRRIPECHLTAICMPFIGRTTLEDVINQVWSSRRGHRRDRTQSSMSHEVSHRNGIGELFFAPTEKRAFVDWILGMAIPVAKALSASHDRGIVHCDIKPSNILITSDGQPVLVDFNVAFVTSATDSPANVGGTLPFMAPEQIRAFAGRPFADISPQTDLFGFGATLYQLLTGKLPFPTAVSPDDGIRAVISSRQRPPVSIRKYNPAVDAAVERLILSCMSYEVADRPLSGHQVAAALEHFLEQRRLERRIRSSRRPLLITTVAASSAALVVMMGRQDPQPAPAPEDNPAFVALHQPESNVQQTVERAYAAFVKGDLKTAEAEFLEVLNADPNHQGALLGMARTCAMNSEASRAERQLNAIDWRGPEPPEITALRGYCRLLEPSARAASSQPFLQKAYDEGLRTQAVLTDLAFCYLRAGRPEVAMSLLERARQQNPSLAETNLLLAFAFANVRAKTASPFGAFDLAYLDSVLESTPESVLRCWVASQIWTSLGYARKRYSPDEWAQMSERAVLAFERGCELNLDRRWWNTIRKQLSPDVLASTAERFADIQPQATPPRWPPGIMILDPLEGTAFERCRDRILDASKTISDSGLQSPDRTQSREVAASNASLP